MKASIYERITVNGERNKFLMDLPKDAWGPSINEKLQFIDSSKKTYTYIVKEIYHRYSIGEFGTNYVMDIFVDSVNEAE